MYIFTPWHLGASSLEVFVSMVFSRTRNLEMVVVVLLGVHAHTRHRVTTLNYFNLSRVFFYFFYRTTCYMFELGLL